MTYGLMKVEQYSAWQTSQFLVSIVLFQGKKNSTSVISFQISRKMFPEMTFDNLSGWKGYHYCEDGAAQEETEVQDNPKSRKIFNIIQKMLQCTIRKK